MAILVAVLVWVAAPVVIWIGWGVDQLENYLTLNALPVGLIWNGALVIAISHLARRRYGRLAVVTAFASALWLIGYAPLCHKLANRVESQYPAKNPNDFEKPFRVILVLGGCTNRLPNGRPEVTAEGQRIVTAAEFWHAGKTQWIVTTGMQSDDEEDQRDAAVVGRQLLIGLGVPAAKILQLPGRNTAEEISSVLDFTRSPPADLGNSDGSLALVTSAFHMPRAMKLARTKGLDVIPLPSGHRSRDRPWTPSDMIPSAGTINISTVLAREFLARLVGR